MSAIIHMSIVSWVIPRGACRQVAEAFAAKMAETGQTPSFRMTKRENKLCLKHNTREIKGPKQDHN